LGQLLQSAPPNLEAENKIRGQCARGALFFNRDLKDLIKEQSPESEKTFAVIDGLDECDNLPQLLPLLRDLATKLYVFVSSRDHPHIRKHFQDQMHIVMDADHIAHDVQQFVRVKLEDIGEDIGLRPRIVDSYFQRLTSGAKGTYVFRCDCNIAHCLALQAFFGLPPISNNCKIYVRKVTLINH
jgi:hypothetical protein